MQKIAVLVTKDINPSNVFSWTSVSIDPCSCLAIRLLLVKALNVSLADLLAAVILYPNTFDAASRRTPSKARKCARGAAPAS